MKIGIVSNGNDTLSLFKLLVKYDNEYLVYHDQSNFPYWEKSLAYVLQQIEKWCEFLLSKWAEVIIVDPVYELALKNIGKSDSFWIMPLFQKYLQDYWFKFSLVWKIWILTDFGSKSEIQTLIQKESEFYSPTEGQLGIKKFSYPFHFWVKSTSSWIYNIHDLWIHNPYLIRTMKNDLRYFKDANVDTVIPMNYHYFRVQRTVKAFFNFQKTRFHDFSVLEECFKSLINDEKSDKYSVSIWTNQSLNFLLREKELVWLMQRGKLVTLDAHEL